NAHVPAPLLLTPAMTTTMRSAQIGQGPAPQGATPAALLPRSSLAGELTGRSSRSERWLPGVRPRTPLDGIHRAVGVGEQGGHVVAIAGKAGDAHAGIELEGLTGEMIDLAQPAAQRVGDTASGGGIPASGQHHHEFVASDPCGHVAMP